MKFLNKDGVTHLWGLIKTYVSSVKTSLETSINTVADGKQDTLVSGTNIKTINGESVLGSGNISIDLTLYKVVTELPTADIDVNKIYLVANGQSEGSNVYTEYMYVNSKWEITGEYKSDVDLTPYAKTEDMNTALALKADKSDTYTKDEVDKKVSDSGTFDSTLYYTKTQVDAKETALKATATTSADGMMSAADKTKLEGIETGAEVNVIETVKVDGVAQAVTDKAVNIDLSGKVDVVTGKQLSANDFTNELKTKLDGIAEGANKTTVDSDLSSTSTNPVQNKAVNAALAGKQATLTAGDNITITGTTISAKDTTYEVATTSADGLLSSTDKTKIDGVAEGATADSYLTDAEIDAACA